MSELIDRQAAIDAVIKRDANCGIDSAEVLKTLPSAQPTDAEIQRMQDIEQAMLDKAYECGKQDAQEWIPCKTAIPEKENTRVIIQTNAGSVIINGVYGGTDVYGHHVWRDGKGGLYWDDEIVAWMPGFIPEPWKGEENNP